MSKPPFVSRPAVVGVINLSTDSFFNVARHIDDAFDWAVQMQAEGADYVDLGVEATNPYTSSEMLPVSQQLALLIPLLERIKSHTTIKVSVDTSEPEVMQASVAAGADLINDQRALQKPGALSTAIELNVPVCLMHGLLPSRQPDSTTPEQLLATTMQALLARAKLCEQQGMAHENIILDPGFGGGRYGKSSKENFFLLKNLHQITSLGYPVLVGLSRKSFIGDALGGAPVAERLYGSIAAATLAAMQGAAYIRVHDVAATRDAIRVVHQVR